MIDDHFSCPSLYFCTASELSAGTGGDSRERHARVLPVEPVQPLRKYSGINGVQQL